MSNIQILSGGEWRDSKTDRWVDIYNPFARKRDGQSASLFGR